MAKYTEHEVRLAQQLNRWRALNPAYQHLRHEVEREQEATLKLLRDIRKEKEIDHDQD